MFAFILNINISTTFISNCIVRVLIQSTLKSKTFVNLADAFILAQQYVSRMCSLKVKVFNKQINVYKVKICNIIFKNHIQGLCFSFSLGRICKFPLLLDSCVTLVFRLRALIAGAIYISSSSFVKCKYYYLLCRFVLESK